MNSFLTKMFYKQRQDFIDSCIERDKRLQLPDGINITSDIAYRNDNCEAHRLDIYRPDGKDNDILPIIVNIHGGGLLLGNKEFNKYFCARVCSLGYMIYSIEYRLIPDCNFFEQLDDVSRAMDYIKSRIIDDNGDIEHVYAVADSGGADLLVYAAALTNSHALALASKVRPSRLKFKALGLISGMFYTNRFDKIGMFLPSYLYGSKYKKSPFAPYINPDNEEVAGSLPPCYMVTSQNDNLQHYTLNFEKALNKYNIPHKLDNFPKASHLTHAFSVFEPFLKESTYTIRSMTDFLKKY